MNEAKLIIFNDDGIKLTDKSLEFTCPVCPDANLVVAEFHGTQVCACSQCKGFLLDSESLGFLVTGLRANYKGPEDKPELIKTRELDERMNCPACYQYMYTHPYYGPGNVVINSCGECKLNWLDQGEFAKLIRSPGRR